MAWVIFLVVALPILGILTWLLLDDSVVRIAPGRVGLLLVRGVATDKTLGPGVHWVPAFRRRMAVEYPGLELAYRAGDPWPTTEEGDEQLERGGPALKAALGDRTGVTVSYTVRFRLEMEQLPTVHNRFGTEGIWAAVRDESGRAMRHTLGDARFGVNDLFGPARRTLEAELLTAVSQDLAESGFAVTMFNLGDLDLGRAGEVIQATARARLELEREEAEAAMRVTRARVDAELGPIIDMATTEAALRYREVDSWRDIAPARGTVGSQYPPRSAPVDGAAPPDARSIGEAGAVETAR